MDDLQVVLVDFNDVWHSASGEGGFLSYEPTLVTQGQRVQVVDCFDPDLRAEATVVSRNQYVAFLLPAILPAETQEESSL